MAKISIKMKFKKITLKKEIMTNISIKVEKKIH